MKFFRYIILFNYCVDFTEKERDPEKLGNVSKVTQMVFELRSVWP